MTHQLSSLVITPSRFFVSPDVYSVTETDGTVILNINSGRLYSLVSAGSVAWRKISEDPVGTTVESVTADLIEKGMFVDQSRHDTWQAVERMLNKLVELGIVYRNDRKRNPVYSNKIGGFVGSGIVFLSRRIAAALIELKFYAIAAFVCLLMFHMVIKLAGFPHMYYVAKKWPVAQIKSTDKRMVDAIGRATNRACVWYPKKAMCLPRAIVTTCLLRQVGIAAVSVIAVQKNPFVGHAWTEVKGKIASDETVVRNDYGILERI